MKNVAFHRSLRYILPYHTTKCISIMLGNVLFELGLKGLKFLDFWLRFELSSWVQVSNTKFSEHINHTKSHSSCRHGRGNEPTLSAQHLWNRLLLIWSFLYQMDLLPKLKNKTSSYTLTCSLELKPAHRWSWEIWMWVQKRLPCALAVSAIRDLVEERGGCEQST